MYENRDRAAFLYFYWEAGSKGQNSEFIKSTGMFRAIYLKNDAIKLKFIKCILKRKSL